MPPSPEDAPSNYGLYRAVISANFISFSMGTAIAWPSPMMPKLRKDSDENPIGKKITALQMAYIFSLLSVGALASTFFSIRIIDHLGRKALMYTAIFFYLLAVTIMFIAKNIETIYMLRVCEGIGAGCTMTVIPIYIGEIALKENRGSCGTFIMLFMSLGQLFDYVIGPYVTFTVFYYHVLVPPIIALIGQFFVPESPTYLMLNGREDDAKQSLATLRGPKPEILEKEIGDIKEDIARTSSTPKATYRNIWANTIERKAFIIVVFLVIFQAGSGAVIMVINPQSIFESAKFEIDGPKSAIIIGTFQALTSLMVQFIVDRFHRRTLLKLSLTGIIIAHLILGTFFVFKKFGDPNKIRWTPLFAGIMFQICYRAGIGPLPFAMLGEMFSPGSKSIAGSTVTILVWASGILITFFYPIVNAIGEYFVFYGLACITFCGLLFVQFVVIETHGLTLKEIQAKLSV